MARYRAPAGRAGRPGWGRGWGRLPGRVGAPAGWYGRFRWGRFYAPNYTGWAYRSYSAVLGLTIYYDTATAAWYYLSPRYGYFVPYSALVEIEGQQQQAGNNE